MTSWSRVTLSNTADVNALVREARDFVAKGTAPDGFGVFRAREGFALYYSPAAASAIDPQTGLNVEECPRPDEMRVRPAVGPYDDPAWYDQAPERMTEELDLIQLDEMGMLGPDTDTHELRRQIFGRGA